MGTRIYARLKAMRKHHAVLWPHKKLSPKQTMALSKPQRQGTRVSNHAYQLRAYQTLRILYGYMSKKHLQAVYAKAKATQGRPGDTLIGLLERRLEMVVYRAMFAQSLKEARQLINHGHITVNGTKAARASTILQPGDVVSCTQAYASKVFETLVRKDLMQKAEDATAEWPQVHEHLEINYAHASCVLLYTPQCVDFPCQIHMDRVLQALDS